MEINRFFILILGLITLLYFYAPSLVCFEDTCIRVTVSADDYSRARGLMQVSKLSNYEGMLFVYPSPTSITFWMKNMLIDLDMIFLDQKGIIVHLEENVPLCPQDPCPHYGPQTSYSYVVEVNSGFVQQNNITLGERVKL